MLLKRFIAVSIVLLAISNCVHAVVVLGGRDAEGNLNNSGSNLNPAPFNLDSYEGSFDNFIGTPISPYYFVTAAHIGGAAGQTISIGGNSYTVVSEQTQNDLAIWEINPTGPAFPDSVIAPIYTGSNEVGNDMVVIGRGGPRGAVITVNGTARGYYWTSQASSAPYSWGEQSVGTIALDNNNAQYLAFSFARQTDVSGNILNPDQGGVSPGDSGGGVFVRDPSDGIYKLAGITYGADGYFNVNSVDSPDYSSSDAFIGPMYDASGLYYDGTDVEIPDDGTPQPTDSYASRISSHLEFIDDVTGVPEPSSLLLACLGFPLIFSSRSFRRIVASA